MKTFNFVLFTALVYFSSQTSVPAQTVLNYSLNNIDGNENELSEIWGEKLTVLDFWATWCKPCLKAIPEIIKLSKEFEGSGVNFIGINEDSPRNSSKVKPLAFSLGINYPVLLDSEQELMNDLLVNSLPTLLIFNKNGEVVFTHIGYAAGDEQIIKETINKLLND
jgi:cytochrome c biogenesis protein CcmG, thiol:disulfide interchange protein DsbE